MSRRVPYYHAHEPEYVRRFSAGHVGWDAGEYEDFFMKAFVTRSLERLPPRTVRTRALDLGCGTGALSCHLASVGFDVTGLDISPSAIALARRQARERGLAITFEVTDVCREPLPRGAFALIIDSHLLHCVVFEAERQAVLNKVRQSLSGEGEFWVETMVLGAYRVPDAEWQLDEGGRLWARCQGADRYAGSVHRDGSWWLPQRLMAPSADFLREELDSAGFRVVEWECYPPLEPDGPGGFRARCVRAG